MGVWAVDPFGNDEACDWAYELEACADLSFIEETLDEALAEAQEYLDASTACRALAAAEILARLQGRSGLKNAYTQAADDWAAQHQNQLIISSELTAKALQVLQVVTEENSELMQLVRDSDAFEEWLGVLKELTGRVKS